MWDDLFWYGCIVVDKLKSELFGEGDFYVPFFLSLWNTFSCMFCILQISMLMKVQVGLSLCSALLLFILHVNNYMNLILTIMLWFKNCHGYKMRLTIKTSFVRCTPTNLSKSPRSDHFFNILTEYKLSGENFRKPCKINAYHKQNECFEFIDQSEICLAVVEMCISDFHAWINELHHSKKNWGRKKMLTCLPSLKNGGRRTSFKQKYFNDGLKSSGSVFKDKSCYFDHLLILML